MKIKQKTILKIKKHFMKRSEQFSKKKLMKLHLEFKKKQQKN